MGVRRFYGVIFFVLLLLPSLSFAQSKGKCWSFGTTDGDTAEIIPSSGGVEIGDYVGQGLIQVNYSGGTCTTVNLQVQNRGISGVGGGDAGGQWINPRFPFTDGDIGQVGGAADLAKVIAGGFTHMRLNFVTATDCNMVVVFCGTMP
jgi:hypothetical protein